MRSLRWLRLISAAVFLASDAASNTGTLIKAGLKSATVAGKTDFAVMSLFINVTLTDLFQNINLGSAASQAQFFRAMQP
jgi:hypothetical protein